MASRRIYYTKNGRVDSNKWKARVKVDWVEYYLGLFDSKEDAETREREFRVAK